MGKIRKIALLVDQPWQAELALRMAKATKRINPDFEFSIVFTDYYTFFLRKDFLTGIKISFDGNIFTQEAIYESWQTNTEYPSLDPDFLNDWEKLNCQDRPLIELAKSNQWVYGNEREKFQRNISNDWKIKILQDTIIWCENLIDGIEPDLIISIERCTLPTNLLFQISRRMKIPFKTFIPARIENRWIVREDFGYGISSELKNEIILLYSDATSFKKAENLVAKIIENRKGAYPSLSHAITKEFKTKKHHTFRSCVYEMRKWLGRVYGRIFIQPKERSVDAVRVLENFVVLSLVELRKIVITHAHLFGVRMWGKTHLPGQPFFFWALHMRPEGSVLVLGDGRDEIAELISVADNIPEGYTLVVKENPEMFGNRDFGFYRRLKKHKNIYLLDPFFESFEVIKNCEGTIGISGTVLLESAILGKPSCALGHPEFVEFLVEHGWNSAKLFFLNVKTKKYPDPRTKMLPYIAYILDNSEERGISFEGNLESSEAEEMIRNFARKIAIF